VRLLATILSPGYVREAAREYGLGDLVLGAEAAYHEARGAIRAYLRHVISRERRAIVREVPEGPRREAAILAAKREARRALAALGYRFHFQRLSRQIWTPWRKLAFSCFDPAGAGIDGFCRLVFDRDVSENPALIVRSVLRALADLLRDEPALNRAILDGRVWERTSPEVMVHAELAPDQIEPVVVSVAGCSDEEVGRALRAQLRAALESARHELAPIGHALMGAWVEAGFLASPAGAMMSDATRSGITHPRPALVPGNGVPLAVAVGTPIGREVWVGIVADHRAGDASLWGRVHKELRCRVPALVMRR
jgi:hypothetical protein